MREEDLRVPVEGFFVQNGMRVHHEVPINGRVADMVAVGQTLMAVELKLTDWKRGLRQAMAYQLACPISCLCLPFEKALGLMRKAYYFHREGIGILGCIRSRGEVRVVLPPRTSKRHLPYMGEFLRLKLRSLSDPPDGWTKKPVSDLLALPFREVMNPPEVRVSPRLEEGDGPLVPLFH